MTTNNSSIDLSDDDLIREVKSLAANERGATVALLRALIEFDTRRLYLQQGCRSLFTYCVEVLHFSEHAAYSRIEAARAARRFPRILDLLADGSINLTTISLLAAHLTDEHYNERLTAATHKSKRELERLIAEWRPKPPVPNLVRKLPAVATVTAPASTVASQPAVANDPPVLVLVPASRRPVVAPLSPEQYRIQLTISKETHDKLRRVQDLMRHTNPKGDPAVIFDRALGLLLDHLEKTKNGAAKYPRPASRPPKPGSRHIPEIVKREVRRRDGERCAFVGDAGRCSETGDLEYHHVLPYADGGEATVANIQLRCRAHNAYEAEQLFGPFIARERETPYGHWVWTESSYVSRSPGPSGADAS